MAWPRRGIRVCRGIDGVGVATGGGTGTRDGDEKDTKNSHGRAKNAGSARDASKSVQQFLRLRNGDALRQVADVEAHLDRGSKFVDAVAAEVRRGPEDASSSVRIVESADDATGRLDFASLFENSTPDASRGVQRARRLGDGEGGGGRGEGELARD